jgi:hypothetical protein
VAELHLNKVGKMKILSIILSLSFAATAFASDLTINGAEFGIGKFHRKDNKVHVYEANNAWKPFVLPENISTKSAYVMKNSADNYTIFFTNLEEFLTEIVKLSKSTGKKVANLNLNAHGLPGGMWFPRDAKFRDSMECSSWRSAANNADDANYSQYYSPVSKEEMLSFDSMSNSSRIPGFSCLTGINEWTQIVARVADIKNVFSLDAQVHMLSCIVGMGTLGEAYTTGLAKLLFANPDSQQVQTSMKFGLGDWSMPEGMGFWGFESDAQLDHDNQVYPVDRRDSEIMQKGSIRVAQVASSKVKSGFIKDENFMVLEHDQRVVDYSKHPAPEFKSMEELPESVRIPGTNVIVKLK